MRLKKHIFLKGIYAAVGVLFVVRLAGWGGPQAGADGGTPSPAPTDTMPCADSSATPCADSSAAALSAVAPPVAPEPPSVAAVSPARARSRRVSLERKHPILSVPSYANSFPDLQDVHYAAATLHGVRPVANRLEAERRKADLVYVGANPFFRIDSAMHRSIPYLVPRASLLLHDIARAFLDSLAVKHIPPHTIIVTSVLRTEEDVARLRRVNPNASEQSCHRFGTTFDISYYRFHTVAPAADGPERSGALARRPVQNDTLKYVLSEVLRDMRASGRCYVKHEVKQGCFHVTTR
ncbi:MAG: hypothetical protein IJS59_05690 [Bacteroidaceae bacterium]|nr:hypothetical protein [Bacteroidaceae bacterium]